jgi:hypothetical protein
MTPYEYIGQDKGLDRIEARLKRLKRIAQHRKLDKKNARSYFEAQQDNNDTDRELVNIIGNY